MELETERALSFGLKLYNVIHDRERASQVDLKEVGNVLHELASHPSTVALTAIEILLRQTGSFGCCVLANHLASMEPNNFDLVSTIVREGAMSILNGERKDWAMRELAGYFADSAEAAVKKMKNPLDEALLKGVTGDIVALREFFHSHG